MSKSLILDIVALTDKGWRPYGDQPEGRVYEKLGCARMSTRPMWFVRGDMYLCIGCQRRCCLTRPAGFPARLPIRYEDRGKREYPAYALTPEEMVTNKHFLLVEEAAYCLNLAPRTVREWIDAGILRKAKRRPVRVLAEDVRREMRNLDV